MKDSQGCEMCQCNSLCEPDTCTSGKTCTVSNNQAFCQSTGGGGIGSDKCPGHNTGDHLDDKCYLKISCTSDASCNAGHKCCLLHCGRKCTQPVEVTDPVMVHAGRCPVSYSGQCWYFNLACSSDGDCRSPREKCCVMGCERLCVMALSVRTIRMSYCMFPEERWNSVLRNIFTPGVNRCEGDSDCVGSVKCCPHVDDNTFNTYRACVGNLEQEPTDDMRGDKVFDLLYAEIFGV